MLVFTKKKATSRESAGRQSSRTLRNDDGNDDCDERNDGDDESARATSTIYANASRRARGAVFEPPPNIRARMTRPVALTMRDFGKCPENPLTGAAPQAEPFDTLLAKS
ncbi:hypothetical protein KM043_008910 [Ampulex compressa]|nr:hypothetical protein KM043_008910 [Ampulex compressa]